MTLEEYLEKHKGPFCYRGPSQGTRDGQVIKTEAWVWVLPVELLQKDIIDIVKESYAGEFDNAAEYGGRENQPASDGPTAG